MAFSTTITLGGLPCLLADPQKYPAAAKKANSYWCPLGPEPGRAWVLMTRASVTSLNKDAALSLVMTHGGDITRTNTFQGLYFVSAKRLLRGGPSDNNAAYLVELEDVRRIAKASSVTAQYNVRAWSMKGDYLDATINDGGPWTWQEIVDDLWGKLPSVVGSSPTLPYTPHGTPEGFQFMGMSAWVALHQVLAKLYCTTAYHPTTGAFSIVSLGASQSGVDSISAAITHDLEPFAEAAHVIPQYVRVHFNTHHEAYGQERDTEENSNWVTSRSSYKVDVATEHAGAIAGTCVDVWDDLAAVYNDSDTLDNQSALEDRADEVAAKWLQDALTANRHRVCIGIDSSILPGSQIRAVLWRNWGESLGSSATEYISHPGLPRPYDGGDMDGEATLPAMRLQAPDIGRASFPVYPRIINAIEITGPGASGKEPGDELDPDDSDMWEGSIKRYVGKQIVTLGSVKVLCPEYDSGKPKLKLGQVVLGRLSGSQDKGGESAGEREPIYLAELPAETVSANVPTVMVKLGGDPPQWVNGEEFEPGCQTVTGQVISACSSSAYLVGQTVDVVFPHVRDRTLAVGQDDIVSAVLLNDAVSPKRFAVTSDYTNGPPGDGTLVWGIAQEDVTEWETGGSCTQVEVVTVDNCYSTYDDEPGGQTIFVVLPEVEGKRPNIHAGDVIAFSQAIDREGGASQFVCVSDYAVAHEPAVIVEINAPPSQWTNGEEFEPGCQTVSGTVIEACGSDHHLIGQVVDVVFPHVKDRLVALNEGDYVSAVLLSDSTSPKRFAVTSDYTKVEFGCGLLNEEGTVSLNHGDLIGKGLAPSEVEDECKIDVNVGCGLKIDEEDGDKVAVNAEELAGDGLKAGDECQIEVDYGCGLTISEGKLEVDHAKLAGDGLTASDECSLEVSVGCGLVIADGKVAIDATALEGPGIIASESGCGLEINAGCGLVVDADVIYFQASEVAGDGLIASGQCQLDINYGCGLTISEDKLQVDNAALAGAGLTASGDCSLAVGEGCGITVSGNAVSFAASKVAGPGLTEYGECGLRADVDCGLKIDNGKIGLNFLVNGGAVAGLTFDPGCFAVSGFGECSAPVVSLAPSDPAAFVEVVTSVSCNEDKISYETQFLMFDQCGRFAGAMGGGGGSPMMMSGGPQPQMLSMVPPNLDRQLQAAQSRIDAGETVAVEKVAAIKERQPYTPADCTLIVTCKDRLDHLKQTLDDQLSLGAGELILVDYECPQGSGDWAEKTYGDRVRVIRPEPLRPGFFCTSHARNCAAHHATGRMLVFIDADIAPERGWLEEVLWQFNSQPQVMSARVIPSEKTWSKTGTCFVDAEAFHQVRGYRECFDGWGYEDIDLYDRLLKVGQQVHYAGDWLTLLQHDNERRVAHFPQKDIYGGLAINKRKSHRARGLPNPEGYGLMRPLSRGVMTAADAGYFPGLQLLAESLRRTKPIPLRCIDLGLTQEQKQWCEDWGVPLIDVADVIDAETLASFDGATKYSDRGAMAKHLWPRPWLASASPFATSIWIDADAVVLQPLDELFDAAEEDFTCFADAFNPAASPNDPRLYDLLPVPRVTNRHANSGVFGYRLDRDGKLFDAWKYCIRQAVASEDIRNTIAWHDQGALIWALHKTGQEGQIGSEKRWNCPPHGFGHRRVQDRRHYPVQGWHRALQDDHPGIGIVHYMGPGKLWNLIYRQQAA